MAITPKFRGPDNVYRERYVFTTDMNYRFFDGQMDPDAVDMQVSIRGGGFTSNPDYIQFEGSTFTIPNPSVYPQGLQLLQGSNRIEVKAILTNGMSTASGVIEATLSPERDVTALTTPPAGVYLERLDGAVKIIVKGSVNPQLVGYNYYASVYPGGGITGYKRINLRPVISYSQEEVTSSVGTLSVDADVSKNIDGSPVANPLYFRLVGMQINSSGDTLQQDFDEGLVIPETVTSFRSSVQVDAVSAVKKYSFTHRRDALPTDSTFPAVSYSEFLALPSTDMLYYAVSAIYLINGVEYESAMSQEVIGAPLVVTPQVADFPAVSRQQIIRDTTLSIFRSHPEVDVKPGSYIRDTFIDPFATEAERIRFIIGFLQAAQSFTTLLAIDDPNGTKVSIPVLQSEYKMALKQAFFLQDTPSVQNLIDNAFDHLAARRGVQRRMGQRARGEVTFYVTRRPTSTLLIPLGTIVTNGTVNYRITSAARISSSGVGSSYDPSTGRWSARAYIQAVDVGSAGNVTSNQIKYITNGPSGIQVVNTADTFGGLEIESNYDLASRADGVLAGVDSGTYRGYLQKATDVGGVQQVNVVEAGHQLMMRDLDSVTGKHWGGKVDIWVRGESEAVLTDIFAFSFDTVINGSFEPVGDIGNLRFRATDPRVTEANPIIEMLDLPAWDFEFQAINPVDGSVKTLDLQDVVLIRPDEIQLSTTYNDPTLVHLTDLYRGTYRFRTSNKHLFDRQPVTEINSFYRLQNGQKVLVNPSAYKLFHPSDPMDLGRSTEAGDYIQVVQPTDGTTPENIPSGVPIIVTGEEHVLLTGPEYLNNLGTNKYTVHVYNTDRTIEYNGPFYSGTVRDYTFQEEDGEVPLAFVPVAGGRLVEGMRVIVDYQHDENYSVEYITNALVQAVQNAVDSTRHCTADVLVKETIPVGVNISATVILLRNQVASTIDSQIRTVLGRTFGALTLGEPIRQSDVIQAIESVTGVSYAVVPLTKLCRQDSSVVVREQILSTESGTDWVAIPNAGWDTDAVKIYLLQNPLYSNTINGGGDYNDFRGVCFNDVLLTTYATIPQFDGAPLKGVTNGACIIGASGLSIPNYSTLVTANRILVALPAGTTPSDGTFTVTYIVQSDTGTKNIEPGPTEYLVLGDLEFIFDDDKDFSALVSGRRI